MLYFPYPICYRGVVLKLRAITQYLLNRNRAWLRFGKLAQKYCVFRRQKHYFWIMREDRKLYSVLFHDSCCHGCSIYGLAIPQVLVWSVAQYVTSFCHAHVMAGGGLYTWSQPRWPSSGQDQTQIQIKRSLHICFFDCVCSCLRVSIKHLGKA